MWDDGKNMGIWHSEVRKPFRFMPPLAWAAIIDAMGLVSQLVAWWAGVAGHFGLAFGVAGDYDVFELAIALAVFEDWVFAVSNPSFALPAPLWFPGYSAKMALRAAGVV